MDKSDLVDGQVLRLTRDVDNPLADRRKKYDFAALPVWKQGTTLTVRVFPEQPSLGKTYVLPGTVVLTPSAQHRIFGDISSSRHSILQMEALLAACEPSDPTLETVLEEAGAAMWGYEVVLKILIKQGKVTLDDVRAAPTEVSDE